MAIQAGEKMPQGTLGVMTAEGPGQVTTEELFAGKKVVLFSDTVACMSVNDTFVMDAWGKDRAVNGTVMMLADGNGDYTKALGLEMDASGFGMGLRGQRFAIIVDDGVAKHVLVEAPGEFRVSAAETVLDKL